MFTAAHRRTRLVHPMVSARAERGLAEAMAEVEHLLDSYPGG